MTQGLARPGLRYIIIILTTIIMIVIMIIPSETRA